MSGAKQNSGVQDSPTAAQSSVELDNRKAPATANDQKIMELLMVGWGRELGGPLTVEKLLEIAGKELEQLFHAAPFGPIPDYLQPHHFVHQCVAEYEDRLEELDRWKARQLSDWLDKSVGEVFMIQDQTYKLQSKRPSLADAEQFWFAKIKPPVG